MTLFVSTTARPPSYGRIRGMSGGIVEEKAVHDALDALLRAREVRFFSHIFTKNDDGATLGRGRGHPYFPL